MAWDVPRSPGLGGCLYLTVCVCVCVGVCVFVFVCLDNTLSIQMYSMAGCFRSTVW